MASEDEAVSIFTSSATPSTPDLPTRWIHVHTACRVRTTFRTYILTCYFDTINRFIPCIRRLFDSLHSSVLFDSLPRIPTSVESTHLDGLQEEGEEQDSVPEHPTIDCQHPDRLPPTPHDLLFLPVGDIPDFPVYN